MKAAIISLGSKSSEMLATAMNEYFDTVEMLDLRKIEVNLSKELEVLYDGKPISEYDCIYAKGSFRYGALLSSITKSLKNKCYMPITANAFNIAHDKIYTQINIQANKIPMPTTYLTATIPAARNILKKVNYPIIMKFPKGTQGKGVLYAGSYASASSILDALDSLKQPFLIQEYVETGGVDMRLLVVGDKVVAAMKRKAEVGEKRANIHAGGIGEALLADAYSKKIAVEASKALGAEVCAVDMLEDIKGPLVIELNISPGLQGITKATDIDIAGKIAKYFYEKTKDRLDKRKHRKTKEIMKDIDAAPGQDIIDSLDFRGNRILLPELVSKLSKLGEKGEVCYTVEKDKIIIKKFC